MRRTIAVLLLAAAASGCSTRAFFFKPEPADVAAPDPSIAACTEVTISADRGLRLRAWLLAPIARAPAASVLLLHGNYGNISYHLPLAQLLVRAGFQVLSVDYEGYGRSQGRCSQESVLTSALAALEYAHRCEAMRGTRLLVYGQSLGGSVAVVAVARRPGLADALVIEGAFTGFRDEAAWTARRWGCPSFLSRALVPERYNALAAIAEVRVPLLVIHSVNDRLVPAFMGDQLYARAREPKQLWRVRGRHARLWEEAPDELVARLRALLGVEDEAGTSPP